MEAPAISTEAYSLTVDTERELIVVKGQTAAAVFYGVQTLVNLAFPDGELAAMTIRDWPRFRYRGLHVDVARNFHSGVTQMKKLLDVMATYKLNKLHFHLSDDEGWRLEIPGLPELTEVHTLLFEHGHVCSDAVLSQFSWLHMSAGFVVQQNRAIKSRDENRSCTADLRYR